MATLNVVCLISGGKDSLYSILHCLENGHNVVAIANLHPPYYEDQCTVDDIDSYMYQTIGHAIVPLYESALGLPLYRQEILGSAVNQSNLYGPEGDGMEDETEALLPLLRKVKARHPEVDAVSTGAILSTYQRTRIESVAIRLGLTPLSYLWQYPSLPPHSQSSLLEDMAAVGQDSRIIKVASGGLDDSFLWLNVADARTVSRLERAVNQFGSGDDGAVLGEGGQYETLAVAGPPPLWKAQIAVDEEQIEKVAGEAGSAIARVHKARVVPNTENYQRFPKVRIPPLLDARFERVLNSLSEDQPVVEKVINDRVTDANISHGPDMNGPASQPIAQSCGSFGESLFENITGEGSSVIEQTRSIMDQVAGLLQASQHSFADLVYASIILRDMADFSAVNAVYGSYFRRPNPPARMTLASAGLLPSGKQLMISISVIGQSNECAKGGLHVQSRSYWAPANIGPYSQAVSVVTNSDEGIKPAALVYISGQIPLIPASMELATNGLEESRDNFSLQAVLALQHAMRIGEVMRVRQWSSAIAFITATSLEVAYQRSKVVLRTWEAMHRLESSGMGSREDDNTEAESFDVWHVKYGSKQSLAHQQYDDQATSVDDLPPVQKAPLLYVVKVDALPRGASIEWATYGLTTGEKTSPQDTSFRAPAGDLQAQYR